uniref:RdRp n=1 Tax=viral metagenome TaxID=1070528 RepID=A0A2V0RCP7_9ZZZZ
MGTYLKLSNTIINYKNLITVKSKTSLKSITLSKDIDFGTIKIAEENFNNDHVSRFPFKMEKFVPQGLMTSLKSEYSEKKGFTPPYPPFYFSLKAGPNANVLSSRLLDSKL